MLLKRFQQTILQRNSNYLNMVVNRLKGTKPFISDCLVGRTKLLRRITFSPTVLSSRNNYDTSNEVKPPALTDNPPIVWPSIFHSINTMLQTQLVIKPFLDNDFSLNDFISGSNQALSFVSSALAREDYNSIEHLIHRETLTKLKLKVSMLSAEDKASLEINKEDIFATYPYQIEIIPDSVGKVKQRFVEVMIVFHTLRGIQKLLKAANRQNPMSLAYNPPHHMDVIVCNYRFIREYTKGVESSWTINLINHFKFKDYCL